MSAGHIARGVAGVDRTRRVPFGLIKYTWPLASKCPRIWLPLVLEMRLTATADAEGCRKSTFSCEPMLKLSQSIATSALDCLMSVVLPTWVMLALPDTTFPPSGWLVALKVVGPHTGAAHGAVACAGGGAACASGASASEIAAARRLRLAFDRARPDFPRPLAVSATGTQVLRTSLGCYAVSGQKLMFSGLREGLIFLLCLYPVGLVRLYFIFRTDKGRAISLRVKISYLVVQFVLALSALLYLLYGKEARESTSPHVHLSTAFYGTWTNVDPNFYNWWTISRDGVMNYGVDANGKCIGNSAIVIDSEHINAPFGNAGSVHVRSGEFGAMVFEAAHSNATHVRVPPDTICRRPGGIYFDSAPYPHAQK
jgi:hypothetical protein